MNIRELDLNLLHVFQAIYLERSISKAAKRLSVTQPAVSKSLKRLRDFTGDRLFYTSGKGVAPTRVAVTLAVPIHHALETVEQGLAALRGFDTATSERRFRIGVNDVVNPVLVPALVETVRETAPNVVLEFVQQPKAGARDLLLRGDLDTAIMVREGVSDGLMSTRLWDEDFVIMVGESNPVARLNTLSEETLQSLKFAIQSHAPLLTKMVDDRFAAAGMSRRTVCSVADEHSLYSLVCTSDLAAVGGRKFSELNNRDNQLVLFDAPFDLPGVEVHLAWADLSDKDQGHRWLREHIIAILRDAYSMLDTPQF